ncbi:MAG: polysaccharide deacetylase family protein [Chloroflexota bacterium]
MKKKRILLTLLLLAVLLASCGTDAPPAPTIDPNAAMTQAFATVNAAMTATAQSSAPTETPVPTATIPRTPPALPTAYQSSSLAPFVSPHAYITDTCQYLRAKWDPNNAAPGTVVLVIMFHGIEKASTETMDPKNISSKDFKKLMNDLHELGFTAINTQQLADFLYTNAKIPSRSVLLVVDDRKFAENFNTWFRPYWNEWGWPVVNSWISAFGGADNVLAENVALEKEGWVDHQAHGVVHNTPMGDDSTDEYLRSELQGSIDVFQQYYGKAPIAIIWPGGGFGVRPVQMARQLGYKLGFTVNPRGPLMFNWIPQADTDDPANQYDIAEGPAGDPLLTLPRYWDTDAASKLDEIRIMGNEAAAYAEQVKPVELDYYDIVCAPTLGPIPAAVP